MIEPCNRRGEETRPGFFRCDSNRLIHPEPGIIAIATCGICPYRNMPDRDGTAPAGFVPDLRFTTACAHRGEVLERSTCTACGMRGQPFEVFACELHGRCMVRRYRNDRPELSVCANCHDFVAHVTASTA
jgi:hypothetical protein